MSDHDVEGVHYFEIAGFGQEMFRCTRWRANLAVPFCAARWHESQKARGERAEALWLSRQCPVGAAHAGEPVLPRAESFGKNSCPRCRRGSFRRLIGGRLCIGCYNREREWVLGKNAKGTVPVKAAGELKYRTLAIVLDPGQPTEKWVEFTDVAVDELELRLSVERVYAGHIEFLELVPHGAFEAWRPDALGGLKAIVTPPEEAAHAAEPAPRSEAPDECQSTAGDRLRSAAGPALSPVRRGAARTSSGPVPAPFTTDRRLAA